MRIERVTVETLPKIMPLIAGYQEFYRATVNQQRNQEHFQALVEDEDRGIMFAAFVDDEPLGFATIYYMYSSVRAAKKCIFNDLFTVSRERGSGVGVQLALRVFQYARERGFSTISWETQKENLKAQRLYDYVDAVKSEWLHYELSLEGLPAGTKETEHA